jgi:hypothetical protein
MLPTPNASPRAEASTVVSSNDELFAACIYAFRGKCIALALEVALLQGNVSAQTLGLANAEQVSHSTHIQPLHQSALPRNTLKAILKAIPPTVPSCISTREKSRAPLQFTLDHVAPYVANLRSYVVALHPTCIGKPCGTTYFLDVQGALPNNRNNTEQHPHPVHTLG